MIFIMLDQKGFKSLAFVTCESYMFRVLGPTF
jgi:hypothetical protein